MRTVTSERYAGRLLGTLTKVEFEEDAQPRDPRGRFAPKGEGGTEEPKVGGQKVGPTPEEVERVFMGRTKPPVTMAELDKILPRYKQGEDVANRLRATPPPDAEMMGVSDKAETVTSAFGKRIVDASERTGVEYVFAVENSGGDVVGMTEGDETSAKLTEILLGMSERKGYTLVHNHPNESSFSTPDLVLFAGIPQFTRAVVTSKGWKYTIEKPKEWDVYQKGGLSLIETDYNSMMHKMRSKYDPGPMPDGRRNSAKDNMAWVEASNELVQEVTKGMGLNYKREKIT